MTPVFDGQLNIDWSAGIQIYTKFRQFMRDSEDEDLNVDVVKKSPKKKRKRGDSDELPAVQPKVASPKVSPDAGDE